MVPSDDLVLLIRGRGDAPPFRHNMVSYYPCKVSTSRHPPQIDPSRLLVLKRSFSSSRAPAERGYNTIVHRESIQYDNTDPHLIIRGRGTRTLTAHSDTRYNVPPFRHMVLPVQGVDPARTAPLLVFSRTPSASDQPKVSPSTSHTQQSINQLQHPFLQTIRKETVTTREYPANQPSTRRPSESAIDALTAK